MEEEEKQNAKDQPLTNSYLSKISSLSSNFAEKQIPFLKQESGKIGDQQISIVSPDQVNVLQTQLPESNPEVPGFMNKAKQSMNLNKIIKKSFLADVYRARTKTRRHKNNIDILKILKKPYLIMKKEIVIEKQKTFR